MGSLIGFILILLFIVLFAVIIGIVLSFIGIIVTLIKSKKGYRMLNCVSVSISSFVASFTFCVMMYIIHLCLTLNKTDIGFGDYRFVRISENICLESIDASPFYIDGKVNDITYAYEIDSLLYGKTKNEELFCFNLANDSIEFLTTDDDKQRIDVNNLLPIDDFYRKKSVDNTKNCDIIAAIISLILSIIAAIVSFYTFRKTAVIVLAKIKRFHNDD